MLGLRAYVAATSRGEPTAAVERVLAHELKGRSAAVYSSLREIRIELRQPGALAVTAPGLLLFAATPGLGGTAAIVAFARTGITITTAGVHYTRGQSPRC